MKRIPAPIRLIEREASYVENHAGLPLTIRVFVGFARYNVFLMTLILLIGAATLVGPRTPLGSLILLIFIIMPWLNVFHYSRLDIFFRPSFRLFSWLYTVKG